MQIIIPLLIVFYVFGQTVGFKGISNYSDTANSLENRVVITTNICNNRRL